MVPKPMRRPSAFWSVRLDSRPQAPRRYAGLSVVTLAAANFARQVTAENNSESDTGVWLLRAHVALTVAQLSITFVYPRLRQLLPILLVVQAALLVALVALMPWGRLVNRHMSLAIFEPPRRAATGGKRDALWAFAALSCLVAGQWSPLPDLLKRRPKLDAAVEQRDNPLGTQV